MRAIADSLSSIQVLESSLELCRGSNALSLFCSSMPSATIWSGSAYLELGRYTANQELLLFHKHYVERVPYAWMPNLHEGFDREAPSSHLSGSFSVLVAQEKVLELRVPSH